jgi:hypothetical protein
VTTGWALIDKRTRSLLGCGNLESDDVGAALDQIIRLYQHMGFKVNAVVEKMPTPPGGELALELEYVRRTIYHWLFEVFEVPTEYVLPGTWKTSRTAATITLPTEWDGKALTTHQRDAVTLGHYIIARERFAR